MSIHHNMTSPNGALSDKTIVYKASDQTVNNSETLVDDDDLFFSIKSGETWLFLASLFVSSSASGTPDIDLIWDNQDGLTGSIKAASRVGGSVEDYADDFTTEKNLAVTTDVRNAIIDGCITATTGGTLKLKWAQSTATVEDTKILACSYLRAERIS